MSEHTLGKETVDELIDELKDWANPQKMGVGASFHCEKWPGLTPSARKHLNEYVVWLKAALESEREKENMNT